MTKPVYSSLSVLEISKIVINEYWHGCMKPKHGEKAKLCFKDTGSYMVYLKREYIYIYIAKDVEKRFDT